MGNHEHNQSPCAALISAIQGLSDKVDALIAEVQLLKAAAIPPVQNLGGGGGPIEPP